MIRSKKKKKEDGVKKESLGEGENDERTKKVFNLAAPLGKDKRPGRNYRHEAKTEWRERGGLCFLRETKKEREKVGDRKESINLAAERRWPGGNPQKKNRRRLMREEKSRGLNSDGEKGPVFVQFSFLCQSG